MIGPHDNAKGCRAKLLDWPRPGILTVLLLLAGQAAFGFSTGTFTSTNHLDLTGVFVTAENEAGDNLSYPTGTIAIGDVTFVTGGASSFYFNPTGGAGVGSSFAAEAELNDLMAALIYKSSTSSGSPMSAVIPVTSGFNYKLQLLFHNNNTSPVFDPWSIVVEGDTWSGFQVATGPASPGQVVTHEFVATDSALNISLFSEGGPNDDTVYLNAFSLELVPEPSMAALLAVGGIILWRHRGSR